MEVVMSHQKGILVLVSIVVGVFIAFFFANYTIENGYQMALNPIGAQIIFIGFIFSFSVIAYYIVRLLWNKIKEMITNFLAFSVLWDNISKMK